VERESQHKVGAVFLTPQQVNKLSSDEPHQTNPSAHRRFSKLEAGTKAREDINALYSKTKIKIEAERLRHASVLMRSIQKQRASLKQKQKHARISTHSFPKQNRS
jgi:hypothetical protein